MTHRSPNLRLPSLSVWGEGTHSIQVIFSLFKGEFARRVWGLKFLNYIYLSLLGQVSKFLCFPARAKTLL